MLNCRLPAVEHDDLAVASLASVQYVLGQAGLADDASFQKTVQPFLAKNCFACHNEKLKSANLSLEAFQDAATAARQPEVWGKVIEKLSAGKMPPPGQPPISKAEVAAVTSWIEGMVKQPAANREPDPGRVTARRLNRVEYNNTIRDLLGVSIHPADEFPVDDSGYGFDNIADVLSVFDLQFVPTEGLCWALDFNVDPMTAIVAQYINGRVHVLKEIYLRNSNTVEMCEQFEKLAASYLQQYLAVNGGRPLPISVYGDATGQARSTSSKSDYDLIKEHFRSRAQFRLKFENPSHNPNVKDRVNSVNAMLKSAGDQIRTYVHPSCKELITDFVEVSWKQGPIKYDLDKVPKLVRTPPGLRR